MLNGYEICLNTINYLISNMQDFIHRLCAFILDYFGHGGDTPYKRFTYARTAKVSFLKIKCSLSVCIFTKLIPPRVYFGQILVPNNINFSNGLIWVCVSAKMVPLRVCCMFVSTTFIQTKGI